MSRKTGIYCRQSRDKKDSVSIETQIDECKKLVKNDNYDVYYDKGWSGKNIERPEFTRLYQDIKNGKIDTVITYKLDRVSRNISDFANLMDDFTKYNVEFISATENFDTSTPIGRAMIFICSTFAQLERETIANRIIDNYHFRAKTGKYFMGGNIPYGYDAVKKPIDGKMGTVLEKGETSEILKLIFEEYINTNSLNCIAKSLNKQNILTRKGAYWSSKTIKDILQNITPVVADQKLYEWLVINGYNLSNDKEDYDGNFGMCSFFKNKNKNEVKPKEEYMMVIGIHEPIISSSDFILVQAMLSNNKTYTKKSNLTYLAGMIKCKECGYSFGVVQTKRERKNDVIIYSYYKCRGRTRSGMCENKTYIPADKLESVVSDKIIEHINKVKVEKKTSDIKTNTNEKDIMLLQTQIDNIIDNIGKGNAYIDDLLTEKISNIKKKIDELKKDSAEINNHDVINSYIGLEMTIEQFNALPVNKKSVIAKSIIDKIEIGKNDDVNIIFKYN